MNTITGFAVDPNNGTGVNRIEITIQRLADDKYWDGFTWTSNITWLLASGTTRWIYDSSAIKWAYGNKYLIRSRGTDNATNVEMPGIGNEFTINWNDPISRILFPQDYIYLKALKLIFGNSTDSSGLGIDSIEITIRRYSDDKYWTGTQWSIEKTWLLTTGTHKWSYDTSAVKWNSRTIYRIQSRATDNGSNVEIPGKGNMFTIDLEPPITAIKYPINNSYLNILNTISGPTVDLGGSGVRSVEINIMQIPDKVYWNGIGWDFDETWITVTGTDQWFYDSSEIQWINDTYYIIRARASDIVGNIEHPGFGNIFMYDNKPPVISIIINNDEAYTRIADAELSLTSKDTGSGVSEMGFSNDGVSWSSWEPFNITRDFLLTRGDGEKVVYLRVRDCAGNIAKPVTDSIILDSTPPEKRKIVINDNAEFTNSELVLLNLTAVDSCSGVSSMAFSFDANTWTPWEPFNSKRSITLPTGDGKKTVYFKVKDRAENYAVASDTIILDTTPPYSLSIIVNIVVSDKNIKLFTLELYAIDNNSGVYQMSFSTDGVIWSAWENYSRTKLYTLPVDDEANIIYFKVTDFVGNDAEPVSSDLPKLEEKIPEKSLWFFEFWYILFLIILIIIIIALAIFVYKHRKRADQAQAGSQPEKAVTIKPGTVPKTVISVGETPPPSTIPQLQKPKTAVETPLPMPATPKVPTLASPTSTAPGQAPTPQISMAAQVPQLPPKPTVDETVKNNSQALKE